MYDDELGINPFAKERIEICYPDQKNKTSFVLGRVNYSKAHPPLKSHVHEGMFEFVLIIKGRQVYSVHNRGYTVSSGEVFITFPDEPHSSGMYPEDKSLLYYILIDIEGLKSSYLGCDDTDGELIADSVKHIENRVFKGSPNLKTFLDGIITAFHSKNRFKGTIIRNLLSCFLLEILDCESKSKVNTDIKMGDIIHFISEHITEDIKVSDLADIAKYSLSRFKMSFRHQVGIPPREFVLRMKVDTAKEMLKTSDMSITDIALSLSFSSSQYFSTVFKRFTCMSPNEFRTQFCRNPV